MRPRLRPIWFSFRVQESPDVPRNDPPRLAKAERRVGMARPSLGRLCAATLLLAAPGCAGTGGGPSVVSPVADAGSWAAGLSDGTKVERPTLIFFRWSVTEEGIRIGGRGAARVAPPYRARLEVLLFWQNLE